MSEEVKEITTRELLHNVDPEIIAELIIGSLEVIGEDEEPDLCWDYSFAAGRAFQILRPRVITTKSRKSRAMLFSAVGGILKIIQAKPGGAIPIWSNSEKPDGWDFAEYFKKHIEVIKKQQLTEK